MLLLIGVLVLGLLAGLAANLAARATQRDLRIDPATAKLDILFKRAQGRGMPRDPMPADFLKDSSFETNENEIKFSWTMPNFEEAQLPAEPTMLAPDGSLSLPEGSLRILALGTAFEESVPKEDWQQFYSRTVPGRFFAPGGDPLGAEQIASIIPTPWLREFRARPFWPGFKVFFSHTNLPPLKVLGARLFDLRTKQPLLSSWSFTSLEGLGALEMEATLWHATPVRLVFDLAVGPTVEHLLPNRPGAEVRLPLGGTKIIERVLLPPGRDAQGFSGSYTMGKPSVTINVRQSPSTHAQAPRTLFFLGLHPNAHNNPFDYDAVDLDGRPLETRNVGTSWNVNFFSVEASPEQIKAIRVKSYPKVYRVIADFPEVPGLPEVNRQVDNLLNVRVPFVLFTQPWERENFLRLTLQVELPYFNTFNTAEVWPLAYTNATLREMLTDYSTNLPPPHRLEYDPYSNRLLVNRGFMYRVVRNLRFLFP